jgi:hypothetical protein
MKITMSDQTRDTTEHWIRMHGGEFNSLNSENLLISLLATETERNHAGTILGNDVEAAHTMSILEAQPIINSQFNVHSPCVRSMFYELKSKLNDLDAVYGIPNEVDEEVKFVPTDEQKKNSNIMNNSVNYFKKEMSEVFDKYVSAQKQCNKVKLDVMTYVSLLEKLEIPSTESQEFDDCSKSIIYSLNKLIEHLQLTASDSVMNRNHHWSQYSGLRQMCSAIDSIQADPICKMCYNTEIDTALNCGHTMCNSCASQIMICPTCRVVISQRLRIFV